jgi:hypothetical protein
MKWKLLISRPAASDIREARRWYNRCQSGLGKDFTKSVNETLEFIRLHPTNIAKTHGEIRVSLIRRFPYLVAYRIFGDRIVVIAVCHTHRDPSGWQSRD